MNWPIGYGQCNQYEGSCYHVHNTMLAQGKDGCCSTWCDYFSFLSKKSGGYIIFKKNINNTSTFLEKPTYTAVYLCFNARNCGNNYTQHTLVCDLPVRPEDGYIASSADSCCSGSGLSYFAMNSSMEGNDRCYMCHGMSVYLLGLILISKEGGQGQA